MVTHDMAEALLLADRIAVMRDGQLIRLGTPRELLREPGDDYVAALLETPRRHGELIHSLTPLTRTRPDMGAQFARQLETLPERLGGHIYLTLVALLAGVAISLPVGILAHVGGPTGASGVDRREYHPDNSGLGPVGDHGLCMGADRLASGGHWRLIMYSILPVLRNTVIGLKSIDPAIMEAARGVGMDSWQTLWMVQLPLALPTIVAGIRTASVFGLWVRPRLPNRSERPVWGTTSSSAYRHSMRSACCSVACCRRAWRWCWMVC